MSNTAAPERLDHIKPKSNTRQRSKPYALRQGDISHYLMQLKKSGRAQGTVDKYRGDLARFREFLGDGGCIGPDSLNQWRQSMIDAGYAPRTVNASMVAANGFLDYIGCHEWQVFDWLELEESESLELSREEYQCLLREARRQENIQLYLMVKTLACADLTPSDLLLLTREALNEGRVMGRMRGAQREVALPEFLREDLLNYAIHRGIRTGPVFLNSNRNPINRVVIAKLIAALGEDAGLEPGKANPRNLRRLHLNALAELQKTADDWVRQTYGRFLDEEEQTVGWRVWLKGEPGEKEENS